MAELAALFILCLSSTLSAAASYDVVGEKPHRTSAFTQGLLVSSSGELIESSGNYGQSDIAFLDPAKPNQVLRKRNLSSKLFAEGLSQHGDELILLTWKQGQALVLDIKTLKHRRTFRYSGEGWGLTSNGEQLIMSNGSAELLFRNPETFAIERRLRVIHNGRPLKRLNELEWVDGALFANVWFSNSIYAINPATGKVIEEWDLSALSTQQPAGADVLNGIAYDPKRELFLITGKYWPTLYELKLSPWGAKHPARSSQEQLQSPSNPLTNRPSPTAERPK